MHRTTLITCNNEPARSVDNRIELHFLNLQYI